jgi:WD40 repeat protein
VEPTQLPEVLPTDAPIPSPTSEPTPFSTLPPPVKSGEYKNDKGSVYSHNWSPDGNWIAVAGFSQLKIWDVEVETLVKRMEGHTSYVWGVSWSPESSQFATAHQDGKVRIWDPLKSEPILVVDAHKGWVRGIAWSPNGQILISSGSDKRTVLWDAASGQLLTEISDDFLPIWSVAWSPDGKYFTSGSGAYEERQPGAVIRWSVMR